jgi:hypothetical protein
MSQDNEDRKAGCEGTKGGSPRCVCQAADQEGCQDSQARCIHGLAEAHTAYGTFPAEAEQG